MTEVTSSGRNPTDPEYLALLLRLKEAEPGSPEAAELVEAVHARYVEVIGFGSATPGGLPYPLPTDPVAEGADAIRSLAEELDTAYVHLWRTTNATPAYNTELTLGSWDGKETGGGATEANGVITVPIAGRYHVAAFVTFAASTDGLNRNMFINVNGTGIPNRITFSETSPVATRAAQMHVSKIVNLSAGDTVQLRIYTQQSPNSTMTGGRSLFWFDVDRIGAR